MIRVLVYLAAQMKYATDDGRASARRQISREVRAIADANDESEPTDVPFTQDRLPRSQNISCAEGNQVCQEQNRACSVEGLHNARDEAHCRTCCVRPDEAAAVRSTCTSDDWGLRRSPSV